MSGKQSKKRGSSGYGKYNAVNETKRQAGGPEVKGLFRPRLAHFARDPIGHDVALVAIAVIAITA
jgi:hypothetical protein